MTSKNIEIALFDPYRLRPFAMSDLAAVAKYAANDKIWKNLRDLPGLPYTEEHARFFLEMTAENDPPHILAMANDMEVVGSIGITPGQNVHRFTAEMGYWVAEPFWGLGLATAAVKAFSDWAFDTFGLHRIHATPFAWNRASMRVLEKAGFEREAVNRAAAFKNGVVVDQAVYARLCEPNFGGSWEQLMKRV